jgi:polar amino acid transport system substrate-binding protein
MVCAATISSVMAGLMLANAGTLVIGTDAPFPAYSYVDAAGTITGYERDIMDQVCARAVLSCAWVDTTFDQLIPGVMEGTFDVVVGGIAVTDDRRRLVDFTTPYHSTDDTEWYIGRPGAPAPDAAMIAVQSGTVHDAHLQKSGRRHLGYSSEAEVLAALASGKADLAFGPFENREDMAALIAREGFEYLYSEALPDDGVAMAVCKGNTDLLDSLNRALDAMRADGTLATIDSRWFQ